jgi:hypothetical protein
VRVLAIGFARADICLKAEITRFIFMSKKSGFNLRDDFCLASQKVPFFCFCSAVCVSKIYFS